MIQKKNLRKKNYYLSFANLENLFDLAINLQFHTHTQNKNYNMNWTSAVIVLPWRERFEGQNFSALIKQNRSGNSYLMEYI